jgi:hypothetical protein
VSLRSALLRLNGEASIARATVERHAIDHELAEERHDAAKKLVQVLLSRSIGTVDDLDSLLSAARRLAAYGSMIDPTSPDLRPALALGCKAAAGIALASTQTSGSVTLDLGSDLHAAIKAVGPNDFSHVGNWRFGFYMGVICNDFHSVDALCGLPVQSLRQSRTKSDECFYLYVDAIQRFWRRDPEISQRFLAALEATEPQAVRVASPDYILNIVVPEMELFYRFLTGDVSRFNETLLFALQRHKSFWSKGDRKKDSEGYLALGLLATCILASRGGLPIEVQSDYIPASLMGA